MNQHATLLREQQAAILRDWSAALTRSTARLNQVTTAEERESDARRLLADLIQGLESGEVSNIEAAAYGSLRATLSRLSAQFAERGLTPSETAMFVFALKEVLFSLYRSRLSGEQLADTTWEISSLIDKLGLFTFEAYALTRERLIKSQADALSDLSTPCMQVWDGVVALPLVGSIDSMRAKEIMEKLLESVVAYQADIAIIDITGVPVVDTQVANRLMRTVEAVRLLGTKSIITGINPIIAQTLVQLGVDLSQLTTKASLRAGLQQAFREMRVKVVREEARR